MFGHFYVKVSAVLASLITLTCIWLGYMSACEGPREYTSPLQRPAPERAIGRVNRNATFLFGIPHVHREQQNYIVSTLQSLLGNVPQSHYARVSYVLLISDPDEVYVGNLIRYVIKKYSFYIDHSMLHIIVPPRSFYPDISTLPTNHFFFGAREKFVWTVKQNYDYAYLMMYCRGLGKYYIQLEDDVSTHRAYIQGLEAGLHKPDLYSHWFVIEFSSLGFIGKMFHSDDIGLLADFLLTFHAHKPVDWLLEYLLPIIACRPEEHPKQCRQRVQQIRYRYTPSLFQHIGVFSSLKGKIQLLQDTEYLPVLQR